MELWHNSSCENTAKIGAAKIGCFIFCFPMYTTETEGLATPTAQGKAKWDVSRREQEGLGPLWTDWNLSPLQQGAVLHRAVGAGDKVSLIFSRAEHLLLLTPVLITPASSEGLLAHRALSGRFYSAKPQPDPASASLHVAGWPLVVRPLGISQSQLSSRSLSYTGSEALSTELWGHLVQKIPSCSSPEPEPQSL